MLNRIAIIIGLLVGSVLAAWGASSTLSGLQSGIPIATTDLFYDVQTVGVGGVKVTGQQFLNFVFGNVSGSCTASNLGVFSCAGGNSTSIVAGSNISTSGSAANVTVNVIATPTFSSITTTIASITGWLTAAGVNMQTATIAGNLTGSTGNFTSFLTANILQAPGFLTAAGGVVQTLTVASINGSTQCVQASSSGNLLGTGTPCSTGQFGIAAGTNITTSGTANNVTVNVVATPTFSTTTIQGNLTATTAQFSGAVTGTTAVFQTVTVGNLTPTGPNCLQETSGVIQATNTTCGSGSGTPGGANTQIQFNNNNAFGGDAGFTYTTPAAVVITSGIVTTNTAALSIFQTWNSSGRTFDAPLFMNITNTASASGSLLADLQIGGSSVFTFSKNGGLGFAVGSAGPSTGAGITSLGGSDLSIYTGSSRQWAFSGSGLVSQNTGSLQGVGYVQWLDNSTALVEDTAQNLADRSANGNAQSFRVYNSNNNGVSTGTPTNYERGVLDWTTTANQFTIGTQQGGTGVGRNVVFVVSGTTAQTISTTATTFAAALNAPAIAQLGANTTGYACWTTGTGAISEDSTTCIASLRRLKKEIAPLTDATGELMALKPSQFHWNDPVDANQRGQQLGFIAEDVRDVDARLASYTGDGSLHGWRQDAMIAALVRGFQEQQAIIQRQQAEIDELKQGRHP